MKTTTTEPTTTATQPAHTPGPWGFHLGRGAKPRLHVQTSGGYQIASTPELDPHRMATVENVEREANARLIAAAPELLAALRALVEFADGGSPVHPGALVMDEARAAVSKAAGQA